ncbi:MAG: Gfo/Idh/MocA family oxidoreductase [Bacteroidota bacterium]
MNTIRIGLLGTGHLGKIHLKLLKQIPAFELVGFYDQDEATRQQVSADFEVPAFDDLDAMLTQVEAVDIVTPTTTHFELATKVMHAGKHVFVEKPLTQNLEEAEGLLRLAEEYPELVTQVGHVERFNPAFLSINDIELNPMFLEGHRLALYNPRGTDVSVVLDLMIHDIDVVLSLIKSPVANVSASGVAVVSETPDIANARIEFENGAVANLTASRMSVKNMRRLRMFQPATYLAVDFLEKKTEIFRLADMDEEITSPMKFEINTGKETKYLVYELPEVKEVNAIKMELEEFNASIRENKSVRVPFKAGYESLKVAHQIIDSIRILSEKVL